MRAMTTWFCDAYALVAKGRGRKRQRPTATLAAPSDRHRQSLRRGNPGHRHFHQSHAQKMPWHQDSFSGNPQRGWQRRTNQVCIALLHLAQKPGASGDLPTVRCAQRVRRGVTVRAGWQYPALDGACRNQQDAWTSSIVVPAKPSRPFAHPFQYDPEHSEPFSESIMRQNQRAAVWTALQEG